MHGRKSGSNVNTSAAISGALTGSASFALVALGLFGGFFEVGSLPLFLVSAVGGVLGAYAGDHLVRWGLPTREPHPLPPADPETILELVEQSDLDRRWVAALLLAAERDDRSDEAS